MKRLLLVTLMLMTTLTAWLMGPSPAWAAEPTDVALAAVQGTTDLAQQSEADAAALAVTADDINTRIDNSEATTLRLSDDIGVMADRIGEMADRILWTELQIGVMADRIVESEYLINDGAQQSADQVQESQAMVLESLTP